VSAIILLSLAATQLWFSSNDQDFVALLQLVATCLAVGAAFRSLSVVRASGSGSGRWERRSHFAHPATGLAVGIFGLAVAIRVVVDLADLPRAPTTIWDGAAVVATVAALIIQLWDRRAKFTLRGLYVVGLGIVGLLLVLRDLSPGTYFVWTGICELTGFVLVAALVGWATSRRRTLARRLRIPDPERFGDGHWFCIWQAVLAGLSLLLILWIALDARFDGLGKDHALFGLAGRLASCPAALILLGGTIVMAWQTAGRWRSVWQYASFAAGVLFTTVIGWSRIGHTSASFWIQRCNNLVITSAMMALLTRFGLARILPHSGDWLERARRAAPVFALLAVLTLLIALSWRWSA
jgi:hypothetical protein